MHRWIYISPWGFIDGDIAINFVDDRLTTTEHCGANRNFPGSNYFQILYTKMFLKIWVEQISKLFLNQFAILKSYCTPIDTRKTKK